jgi:hypothetical protein
MGFFMKSLSRHRTIIIFEPKLMPINFRNIPIENGVSFIDFISPGLSLEDPSIEAKGSA